MRTKLKPAIQILFVFATGLIAIKSSAQHLHFKSYGVNEGICHPFIYSIAEDKDGYLWLGTGEGLCIFDGYTFKKVDMADTVQTDIANVSFKDDLDNLWFGFNNGVVLKWNGQFLQNIDLQGKIEGAISGITALPNGQVLISSKEKGAVVINGNRVDNYNEYLSETGISCLFVTNGYLLVGTMTGLKAFKIDESGIITEEIAVNSLEYINILAITRIEVHEDETHFLIGTEDEGLYLATIDVNEVKTQKIGVDKGLNYENIQHMLVAEDNTIWVSTYFSGLLQIRNYNNDFSEFELIRYDASKGVNAKYIKTAYFDIEGNLWVGTYGDGLLFQAGGLFSFLDVSHSGSTSVKSITSSSKRNWYATEKSIIEKGPRTSKVILQTGKELPRDLINCIYFKDGILWIGTNKNGIYKYNVDSKKLSQYFVYNNSLSNSINYLLQDDDYIYAATKDGIFSINLATKEWVQYNTRTGLSHNDIKHLYLDKEGRLFFATKSSSISHIDIIGELKENFTIGKFELSFNSITEDANGTFWISTYGQGVFHLSDTIIGISEKNGLKSDYCYGVFNIDSNYIWVSHSLGVSRIDIMDYTVKTFDQNVGFNGDCNLNSVSKGYDGNIYFGTNKGVVIYDQKRGEKILPPPRTNLVSVSISDKEVDKSIEHILKYDAYKLKFEFVGINFNNPNGVNYQYKLEGYDLDWSEPTKNRSVTYPRIEDGDYTFIIRAYSSNGLTEEKPVQFSLKIKAPVWKRWWFISLMVILMVTVVYIIIIYREKQQKQIQEYLEKRLDERTREVVEQKEEIETKNRDITDSINYAQRIQTSILPPLKKLQQNFTGSFVFYQPRDIVSGDFYWFDKISDSKFIIVCADSTGHGVPGAFMSMIGTTLLKDICIRDDVNSPSEILRELDKELCNTLNQDAESVDSDEKSNDGMDIIVCEVDINTFYMRYASAMRPMIVYKDGVQIYLKGSRSSVGGHYDSKEAKEFKDEGIQLSKGDLIYMFSDGYPDQFGGPVKKKFKMVRLKNLLKEVYQKPMEEQYEYVKSTFNLWKEDVEQVDDVLFMGIRI